MVKNIAHSVRERLLSTSKRLGVDYQVILTRYFHERFLYRLAQSSYKGNLCLKGGTLLVAYEKILARPTLDMVSNWRSSAVSPTIPPTMPTSLDMRRIGRMWRPKNCSTTSHLWRILRLKTPRLDVKYLVHLSIKKRAHSPQHRFFLFFFIIMPPKLKYKIVNIRE